MRPFLRCGALLALTGVACVASAACGSEPDGPSAQCEGVGCSSATDGGAEVGPDGSAESDGDAKVPSCSVTSSTDDPDDNFEDENCDGIDGDLTKAVFVSPSGSDSSAGSMGQPVRSIAKAIELAASSGKDVYACNATYAETLIVTDDVRVFGGYDCTDGWKRTKERVVVAPGAGTPLVIDTVSSALFDRFDFRAPDGSEPGESSIAAIVRASTDVRLNRVTLEAGSGASGESGDAGKAITTPAKKGANGTSITLTALCPYAGTPTGPCLSAAPGGKDTTLAYCGPGDTLGSRGGYGGYGGNAKTKVAPQNGGSGYFWAAKGGVFPFAGNPGQPGKAGGGGTPGGAFGSIVNGLYSASNAGTDGQPGTQGEAGGGGSGGFSDADPYNNAVLTEYSLGSGGGQGGYPGCGGEAGKGGGGGGASIALLVIDSSVDLAWSSVRTSSGGAGGQPGAGATGQPGGAPGNGGTNSQMTGGKGKPGGGGGNGGAGGPGGAGGGGPSIGILVVGNEPTTEATSFDIGAPGAGASGMNGADGASGQTGDVIVLSTP
jgi:hypothetical protein